jgi:hypothetical protein
MNKMPRIAPPSGLYELNGSGEVQAFHPTDGAKPQDFSGLNFFTDIAPCEWVFNFQKFLTGRRIEKVFDFAGGRITFLRGHRNLGWAICKNAVPTTTQQFWEEFDALNLKFSIKNGRLRITA